MRRGWVALVACVLILPAACSGSGGSDGAQQSSSRPSGSATSTTPPGPARDFSDRSVAVVAHRGASGYAPEHTFAAYDLALQQGADYLEQDLQLTADGRLVVLHDSTLDRTTRGPAGSCSGPVADKTVAQIETCDAGSWFDEAHPDRADPSYVGLRVPTLEAVLHRYGSRARYYIEVKAPGDQPGIEDALLDLLASADLTGPDPTFPPVVIQSFSGDSLRLIHERRPDLPLVQLLPPGGSGTDPAALDEVATYAVAIGPPAEEVDASLVQAAHQRCLDVHPWTVDDPGEMARLLDLGVGAMFTDTPDVLAAARDAAPAGPGLCQPAATPTTTTSPGGS